MSKRTVILAILDGWGIGKKDMSNPVHVVDPQNIRQIKENFSSGSLQASGISVGLPWGEEGNSEVGHINIGAGQIIYQHYPKITIAIRNKSFFENEAIKKAFAHAKENNSSVNLIGLLSEGNVHSSLEHLKALLDFGAKENFQKINLHLFTDGRDSAPTSAAKLISQLPKDKLAGICGRFIAMDRDKKWDRTEKAYEALVGGAGTIDYEKIGEHLEKTYRKKLNDEYIDPVLINPARPINENDSLIFFNFRKDRMRQIIAPFANPEFKEFTKKDLKNLFITTMTNYGKEVVANVAYKDDRPENPLGKVLSDNGKVQFRITETQKYPHVTYFFNGLKEEPFKNEYRILIPSNPVFRQEEDPKMRAPEIVARTVEAIEEKAYDFILINIANPDMLGHTGNFNACLETIKIVDEQIGKLMTSALAQDAILIITSDHGNIENVLNQLSGEVQTQHDPNPVPIYFVAKEFERKRSAAEINESEKITIGILADIAPTILELMKVPKPKEMTGQSLLRFLK